MYFGIRLLPSRQFYIPRFTIALATSCGVLLCVRLLQMPRSQTTFNDFVDEVKWVPRYVISCHNSRKNDALPLLPTNTSLPVKSIFFHETSCLGDLTSRQACAVESAARAHPQYQINVLFTSAVSKKVLDHGCLRTLVDSYKNVKLARVQIKSYVSGTPLEFVVKEMHENHLNMRMSKIMKYLTLYKYSGIYLGSDVIVARSLDELWKNWVIKNSPMILSTDMFSFSENKFGRQLAKMALGFLNTELKLLRKHDLWSYSGSNVMNQVLKEWCTTSKVQSMSLSSCPDLAVFDRELFYPISLIDRQVYFNVSDWNIWKEKRIYTYVLWNKFTKYNLVSKFSLYWKIVNAYCPKIFKKHGKLAEVGLWYPF